MKIKSFMKYLYAVIFIAISITPLCLYAFVHYGQNSGKIANPGQSETAESDENRGNIEKKENVSFPLIFDGYSLNLSFDDECEEWLNQNIPFRDVLLTNINLLLSDCLKTPTSNVVTGRYGWIYSTETTDDYMDTGDMGAEDIRKIANTLFLIQERVNSCGGKFLFVPAPNKNSIYPEYMPKRYIKASENNLDRLCMELDKSGVNYVDLKNKMLSAKSSGARRLYYKRDTHWNPYGAIIGYGNIMKGLERSPLLIDSDKYTVSYTRRGDLDKLLYPAGYGTDEDYVTDNLIDYESFEFIYPSGITDTKAQLESFMSDREDHDNNFTTKKRTPEDNSTLYMIRDSFGRALLPYMIDSFAEATFVRTTTPSIEKSIECTDVVYEICERNLGNLISSAPFMFAPERSDFAGERAVYNSELNRCFFEDEGYGLRIYGTVDLKMVGEDGRIYLALYDDYDDCNDGGKSDEEDAGSDVRIFEAFPIYEDALMAEKLSDRGAETAAWEKSNTCGYSLYIDKSALDKEEYGLSVLSGNFESDVLAEVKIDVAGTGDDDTATEGASENTDTSVTNPYEDENADHGLLYRGVTIGIGDNINNLKSSLGAQAAPSEIVTSCLSGEDAMLYYYPGISVETEMDGTIYYISLMDNSYSDGKEYAHTRMGITIGSDKADIWEKLGNPAGENDKNCIYQTEHLNITYSYKSGKVTSVILEDRKYSTEDVAALYEKSDDNPGVEYEGGNTYLYDEAHLIQTGWQIIDGEYYFFDRQTGERIVGQTVDGIEIGEDGEVSLSEYDKNKIEAMMKAHKVLVENTLPTDSMEEKRRKVFDWVLSFPYHRYRHLKDVYEEEGIEIVMANDIFDEGAGDCVSESAALALLFHEIGYTNVYWVHDTGHSWVRSDDKLFDPLFAESRDFEANYDAEFTDYRATMAHSLLIY